jgi:hypothetical protein
VIPILAGLCLIDYVREVLATASVLDSDHCVPSASSLASLPVSLPSLCLQQGWAFEQERVFPIQRLRL